jgi:hypothetical protein
MAEIHFISSIAALVISIKVPFALAEDRTSIARFLVCHLTTIPDQFLAKKY